MGKKARELKKATDTLHQEERSGSKGRKWRKNVKAVEKVNLKLFQLCLEVHFTFGHQVYICSMKPCRTSIT